MKRTSSVGILFPVFNKEHKTKLLFIWRRLIVFYKEVQQKTNTSEEVHIKN